MDVYAGKSPKQKTKAKTELFRLVSGGVYAYEELTCSDENLVPYNRDYKLDSDEWFKVDEVSSYGSDLINYLKNFNSKIYGEKNYIDAKTINFIILRDENVFYLQTCTASVFVKKYSFLKLLGVKEIDELHNVLYIKPVPDAIYFKDEDKLIFKNYVRVVSIFPQLEDLFYVAKSEDLKKVMNDTHLEVDGNIEKNWQNRGYNIEIAKLSLLIDSASPNKWDHCLGVDYKTYCSDPDKKDTYLTMNNGKVVINNCRDLKNIVHLLNYDFYTTIENQKRMSNSHREV